MNVEYLEDDDLRWADLVFVSAMSVQKESVNEVIGRCKAAGVRIVAGGPFWQGITKRRNAMPLMQLVIVLLVVGKT